jgi:putative transposase
MKRRSRVVGMFPTNASVIRLVRGVLLDMHVERIAADRRHLAEGSMTNLNTIGDTGDVAAIEGGT